MPKKKLLKRRFNWAYFFILLILVLITGIFIIIWSIYRPFCANSLSCKESLTLKVENGTGGIFNGEAVNPPVINLDQKDLVLGEAVSTGEKHIYVDLSTQTLRAFEGNNLYMEVPVSTGKWNRTPTGEFDIWIKLRATRMTGGEGADFYDLPNVPYVMFFEGKGAPAGSGFSLHGAYWHNNFGHPMSHGCVNMRTIDAKKLYEWVSPEANGNVTKASKENPGTKITIYGKSSL